MPEPKEKAGAAPETSDLAWTAGPRTPSGGGAQAPAGPLGSGPASGVGSSGGEAFGSGLLRMAPTVTDEVGGCQSRQLL